MAVPKQVNNYKELCEMLAREATEKNREFNEKIIPTKRKILGVKVPVVRKIAAMILREKIDEFLDNEPVSLEEVLARGFLICRLPYDEMVLKFDSQVGYIDDWCSCDTFCSGLRKSLKSHEDEFLKLKIEELLKSSREYTTRVGLVLLKCYYVKAEHLKMIFEQVERLASREEYYIRMAIAWLLSECFIKYPTATTAYLIDSNLPKWTFNKTISKICDSYRVDAETKKMLKRMRK